MPQNACGAPVFHPYLVERRVANQDRRTPAEEHKPSAYHAQGHRPLLGDRCAVPFTRRTSDLESETCRYGWSFGTPQAAYSFQIPNSVTIGIGERSWVYLVHHAGLPPRFRHGILLFNDG